MDRKVTLWCLVLLGLGTAATYGQLCPIVDRGSPVDGVTTITITSGPAPCIGDPLFTGWQCMTVQSAANDNGVTYDIDIRWNLVSQTPRGSFTWLSGGPSTESMRSVAPTARQAQDELEMQDQIRTIEVRYLGTYGSETPPRNGFPNVSATYADVLEFLVFNGIAQGVVGHYGNSAGSMQAANSLAYHGLEQLLDGVVFGGGPFETDLQQVCTDPTSPIFGSLSMRERVDQLNWLDINGGTFCADMAPQADPSYDCRSLLGSEADSDYPNLMVSVIVGTLDQFNPWMTNSAADYLQNITAQGKTFDRPDGVGHAVYTSALGAQLVAQRIRDIVNAKAPMTGDANCDGLVNLNDVGDFVLALIDPGLYQSMYPGCIGADVNGDGMADGDDIWLFVNVLVGP